MNQPVAATQVPGLIKGKLTEVEMLQIENLTVKVQNMALQEQRLQADLMKANELRRDLQTKLLGFTTALGSKYGVNISAPTTEITADGTVIDRSPQPVAAPPAAPQALDMPEPEQQELPLAANN